MQRSNRPLTMVSVALLAAFCGAGWYTHTLGRTIRHKLELMQTLDEQILNNPRLTSSLTSLQIQRDWRTALAGDDLQQVGAFLQHGFTVNTRVAGQTPLDIAADRGAIHVGRLLLAYGAKVDTPDDNGKVALLYAVQKKRIAFAKMLLANGAQVDGVPIARPNTLSGARLFASEEPWACDLGTPLACAVATGNEEMSTLLLAHGAKVNHPDGYSMALEQAIMAGNPRMAKLLVDHGAQISRPHPANLNSPLIMAVGKGDAVMVKLLLEHGADYKQPVWDGQSMASSMLQYAMRHHNQEIIHLLEQAGTTDKHH